MSSLSHIIGKIKFKEIFKGLKFEKKRLNQSEDLIDTLLKLKNK